jgi:Nuclease-related domain
LIPFTLWLVGIVEAIQKLGGQKLDPRFWMFLSILITIYTGVRIFRLSGPRNRIKRQKLDAPLPQIVDRVRSSGLDLYYEANERDGSVDYIVVGHAGIYALEVKARNVFGSRRIDYRRENELVLGGKISDNRPLQQARVAAQKIRDRLAGHLLAHDLVKPLVVFLGDWQIDHPATETDVAVVSDRQLEEYFRQQPPILSDSELAQISTQLDGLSLSGAG